MPPGFRVLDDQTARDLRSEARARVLERAGAGETALAEATAHLVTQTSEARLHVMLDTALGGDRRKLDRFLSGLPDNDAMIAAIRLAHGAEADATPESVARSFCADVSREEANCAQDRIVAAGRQGRRRQAVRTAAPRACRTVLRPVPRGVHHQGRQTAREARDRRAGEGAACSCARTGGHCEPLRRGRGKLARRACGVARRGRADAGRRGARRIRSAEARAGGAGLRRPDRPHAGAARQT